MTSAGHLFFSNSTIIKHHTHFFTYPMPRFICAVTSSSRVAGTATGMYRDWISQGFHAGMSYLDRHHDLRADPSGLLDPTRTVMVMAFPYPGPETGVGRGIASYALGDDYHDVLREYLNPLIAGWRERAGGEWRLCIDSAPLPERYWAVASGLASPTRSGNVAVGGLGTRLFLATLLTTLPVEDTLLAIADDCGRGGYIEGREGILRHPADVGTSDIESRIGETCGECRRCLEACPGGAIRPGGVIDARRCLSYLTIEHRGDWTDPTAVEVTSSPAGRHTLFGCDVCVRVCPLNNRTHPELEVLPLFKSREEYVNLTPRKIVEMTQEEFSATFRRSAIKRAKLAGLRRNAANCLHISPSDLES